MSLLYQPLSRSARDISGCLTPVQADDNELGTSMSRGHAYTKRPVQQPKGLSVSNILSPPLSPYQRAAVVSHPPLVIDDKSYLESKSPFTIENYKDYKLTIHPWTNLQSNYKASHLHFINQYHHMSAAEPERSVPRRFKRRLVQENSDDNSSDQERVRTRRVARSKDLDSELDEIPATPPPKKKKVRRDTPATPASVALQQQMLMDDSIPDYSPDASATLPANNSKCLKIEWKGQPMDLSSDPNLSKLHPAEVVLASILRLPVLVYLDSKRRLFHEKLQRVRSGRQFRRTDAQKACRIDVNKASRLFAAFEKVGWLNDAHFEKYL
ncbi:SWIRM-domain-containing protein [Suhomyces tanzawaensis NRRL Y-17324]|uniref:SWIRM-domain-containing protein n=1 Tax=Suhomyces tanzawaensis NRRL Y-17324 TaxID=984487 RepID=A0A1E4SSA9_9ASCO|nr:SWIRM-domain-containing protein [Suhomyces tanzawaensis NRRL Y-17324]ODV82403.1 SWIRM-domain-containing protein [Suhomyces tanzawaensis NRRL Y-17324]